MPGHIGSKYFSQADLNRIVDAVKEAESRTSGEVVPYFLLQSDHYEEAGWRSALLLGSLSLTVIAAVRLFSDVWPRIGTLEVCLVFFSSSILGAFVTHFLPPLKRFFAGKESLHRRVHQRAAGAFLSEEVFKTRDRTGILIFLSFFERMVVILADSGINAKVNQSEWDAIVQVIVKSMKEGRPGDGLVEAINRCGVLLQKHGVARSSDDSDELSDQLRISKD